VDFPFGTREFAPRFISHVRFEISHDRLPFDRMVEVAASNARVMTFFQRDPVDFIDDMVMAVSHYVQSGIESLSSIMMDVKLSENHKRAFMRELTAQVMHSLNVNSDIFEMYVMRNIFHIPVDIDLAGSIMESQDFSAVDLDRSFSRDGDSDDLDDEIRELTAKIYQNKEKRKQLLRSVKENEARLKISQTALDRIPAIVELEKAVANAPCDQMDSLLGSMQKLLSEAKRIEPSEPTQSLVFHQTAFNFD
jgi:hypothetical protein